MSRPGCIGVEGGLLSLTSIFFVGKWDEMQQKVHFVGFRAIHLILYPPIPQVTRTLPHLCLAVIPRARHPGEREKMTLGQIFFVFRKQEKKWLHEMGIGRS